MFYYGICKIEIVKSIVCKIVLIIRRGFEVNSCKVKCKWGDGELDFKFYVWNWLIVFFLKKGRVRESFICLVYFFFVKGN